MNIKLFGRHNFNKSLPFLVFNLVLIVFQFIYILLRIGYVNTQIPFWYTTSWGEGQLAPKSYLYVLPIVSFLIVLFEIVLSALLKKYFVRHLNIVLDFFVTFCVVMMSFSLMRIIFIASVPFTPLISPFHLKLGIVFITSFFTIYLVAPFFIEFLKNKDIVTNPMVHSHPAMLIQKPTVRGGGFLYSLSFLLLAILFIGFDPKMYGLYISVLMLGLLGMADDFQNTHKNSSFKALENPFLRLFLLACGVSIVVVSGIKINLVAAPFAGILDLSKLNFVLGGRTILEMSALITLFWLVLIPNILSWSNGTDGQFAGIIGISSFVVAILALRFSTIEPIHEKVAILALISSGISFGFTKYTWYPSKMLWGFGAISAGLVISVLGILSQTKVVVTILIMLIPFLDGLVTMIRRVLQKRNPLKGDRGHLHHLLLDRGWGVRRIAVFYWLSTALFGLIGILSSEAYLLQMSLFIIGLIALIIVLMNLWSIKEKKS